MKDKKIPQSFVSWLKRQLKDEGDMDRIDVVAHYDFILSLKENKEEFKRIFSTFFKPQKSEINKKEQREHETRVALEQNINHLNNRFGVEINIV